MKKPTTNPHTVTLTEENFTAPSFFTELTGFSHEELVNYLLADEFTCFNPNPEDGDEYVVNSLGCLKYKDKEKAKQTLDWCTEYIKKMFHGHLPKNFETSIRRRPDGTFEINAFRESSGKTERLC
jgi:hypothetical protein